MSALPPKADIAFEARWLWALITRYLVGKRKVLRRRIAFNFSPKLSGGAHGQGDVEIGAHSKNR